jgi:hypothetical protein
MRVADDLSLAVMRPARQLRLRRPESLITLWQLSTLATVAKDGVMTPGALADLGLVVRTSHPADGRQVLAAVSEAGTGDKA